MALIHNKFEEYLVDKPETLKYLVTAFVHARDMSNPVLNLLCWFGTCG